MAISQPLSPLVSCLRVHMISGTTRCRPLCRHDRILDDVDGAKSKAMQMLRAGASRQKRALLRSLAYITVAAPAKKIRRSPSRPLLCDRERLEDVGRVSALDQNLHLKLLVNALLFRRRRRILASSTLLCTRHDAPCPSRGCSATPLRGR